MNFRAPINRIAAWMAIFAILLTVFAPGISNALESNQSGQRGWNEICSASGPKLIKSVDVQKSGTGESVKLCLNHCPFCSLQSTSPAITGLWRISLSSLESGFAYFANTGLLYLPSDTRIYAQPRAPPGIA